MSRELPRRPSLDHLRKQAKELLRHMQQTRPGATLSDAQHALAGEYGFESWPKLKAHVEAAAAAPPPAFHRFTHKAKQALFFSRMEAGGLGSRTIEPAHVLLGLIKAAEGVPRSVFAASPLSLDAVRRRVSAEAVEPRPFTEIIPFGAGTRGAIDAAIREADTLRHERIGLAHLVLGILHDSASEATAVLHDAGLRIDMVRHVAGASVSDEPNG